MTSIRGKASRKGSPVTKFTWACCTTRRDARAMITMDMARATTSRTAIIPTGARTAGGTRALATKESEASPSGETRHANSFLASFSPPCARA
jgi:hypothetical protein